MEHFLYDNFLKRHSLIIRGIHKVETTSLAQRVADLSRVRSTFEGAIDCELMSAS